MMLGVSPLRAVANELRCACCGRLLPGRAAGANISGHYAGPVLVNVTVTTPRGTVLHACPPAADDHQEAPSGPRSAR